MVIKLNNTDKNLLNDRIIAGYFSNLKFIEAFLKRDKEPDRFLYTDRFSLKTFLQEFNVIRNIIKDKKDIQKEERNLIRVAQILYDNKFDPNDIDTIADDLQRKDITKVMAISMTSKMFFLGNPEKVFIYDRFVKAAMGFKNGIVSYKTFFERIKTFEQNNLFQEYIMEIESELTEKLMSMEVWAGYPHGCEKIRRMRVIDGYLMYVGMKGKSLFQK